MFPGLELVKHDVGILKIKRLEPDLTVLKVRIN